jgi:hypothetical protein
MVAVRPVAELDRRAVVELMTGGTSDRLDRLDRVG